MSGQSLAVVDQEKSSVQGRVQHTKILPDIKNLKKTFGGASALPPTDLLSDRARASRQRHNSVKLLDKQHDRKVEVEKLDQNDRKVEVKKLKVGVYKDPLMYIYRKARMLKDAPTWPPGTPGSNIKPPQIQPHGSCVSQRLSSLPPSHNTLGLRRAKMDTNWRESLPKLDFHSQKVCKVPLPPPSK